MANHAGASFYEALANSDPTQKAEMVLRLVEDHPQKQLHLPCCLGARASLDGIDLSRERLAQAHDDNSPHTWWNAERQAVDLRHCDLGEASLRGAQLQGVLFEEANMTDADLAGADLQAADMRGAILEGALLEGADLRKAVLRFVHGSRCIMEDAKLQGADLWGAAMQDADLSDCDLQGATLEEANLQGADCAGVDFRGAVLKRTNFKGADLRRADLRGAVLGDTNFEDALLQDARMEELDLTGCEIKHIHASGARLEKTRLDQEQLGGAIGEESSGDFGLARKGYLALERNFDELGDHDAARWAYGRRRRMEKRDALKQAQLAIGERRWWATARGALKYMGDQVVEWVCDYGESVWRVLATLLVIYVLFTAIYALTGTVLRIEDPPAGRVKAPTYDPVDLALFSLTAMTAPGNPPDYLAPRNELAYLLASAQTILSIFLIGLMGFVAGNRIRR